MRCVVALTVSAALSSSATQSAWAAEKTVEFEAKRVEIEPDGQTMRLEGDVAVRSERYRLSADAVEIKRTRRGVWVDGQGRVAFCPCESPPVTVGFRRALVAPPTDLVLEQPTLRIGSVPVAWAPYLWIRSSRRFGLLPPKLAWRAQDGFLAGLGAHAPLDDDVASVDVRAAGYFRGGVEVETRLVTERSSTTARFDHLGQSMVVIDSRGFAGPESGTGIAWDVDAVRGARARRGPLLLETAARRYDRVRVGSTEVLGSHVLGVSVGADAERGGPVRSLGAVGPAVHVGVATALGRVGTVHETASAITRHDAASGVLTAMSHEGRIALRGRPGVASVDVAMHSAALGLVEEAERNGAVAGGLTGRLALPLVKRFDGGQEHLVEPFVEAGGKAAAADAALPWLHGDRETLHAAAGVRSVLGHYGSRRGLAGEVRGGVVGPVDAPTPGTGARITASTRPAALSADAAWLPRDPESVVFVVRGRIGAPDGINLSPHASGRSRGALIEGRTLDRGGWGRVPVGWLDRPGYSAGLATSIPWTTWLATGVDADADLSSRTLLGIRGGSAYRHPCGCLALTAWGGYRRARDGVDVMLTVDLAP